MILGCISSGALAEGKSYDCVKLSIQKPKLDVTIWHDGSIWVCDYVEVRRNYFQPKTIYTAPAETVDFSSFVDLELKENKKHTKNFWITVKENGLCCSAVKSSNDLTVWSKMLKALPASKDKASKDLLSRVIKIIQTEQSVAGNPLGASESKN